MSARGGGRRVGPPGDHGGGGRGARPRAATPSTRASRPASRPRSPSPRSRAWAAAGSSSPARPRARRCCSTSSSTPPAAAAPARRRVPRLRGGRRRASAAPTSRSTWASARSPCPAASPGWLHAHARLGRLPLDDVTAPARRLADDGVVVNEQQAYLLRILEPILHPHARPAAAIVAPGGRRARRRRPPGQPRPGRLPRVASTRAASPRPPLARRDRRGDAQRAAACSPPPTSRPTRSSSGAARGAVAGPAAAHQPAAGVRRRARRARPPAARGASRLAGGGRVGRPRGAPSPRRWSPPRTHRRPARSPTALARRRSTGGTTHVSVSDADGQRRHDDDVERRGLRLAHPRHRRHGQQHDGRGRPAPRRLPRRPPGERVASMMAPSLVVGADGARRARRSGSGGSKRIRTALLQVIAGAVDQGRPGGRGRRAPAPLGRHGAARRAGLGSGRSVDAARRRWPVRRWARPRPLLRRRPRRGARDGEPRRPAAGRRRHRRQVPDG